MSNAIEQRIISTLFYMGTKTFWSLCALSLLLQFPSFVHKEKFRMAQGMNIRLNLNSPAYAALEDINYSWESPGPVVKRTFDKEVRLVAGVKTNILEIFEEPTIEQQPQLLALDGMRLKQTIKRDIASVRPRPLITQLAVRPQAISPEPLMYKNGRLLPLGKRKQLLAEYYGSQALASPTSGLKAKARELVYRELRSSPSKKKLAITPSVIIDSTEHNEYEPQPEPEPKEIEGYELAGNLEIVGGLAYTGVDNEIEVFRIFQDEAQELARVNMSQAEFSIQIPEMTGYILAEIRNKQGQVLGFGELDLVKLSKTNQAESVSGLRIKIEPVFSGLKGTVVSSDSFGSFKMPVKDLNLSIDGIEKTIESKDGLNFEDNILNYGSSFTLRASGGNHWGSLAIGVSGEKSHLNLYPTSNVEFLLREYIREENEYGVVWGRVVDKQGKPVAGAEVELPGDISAGVIYFNEVRLPDRKLKKTSSNGWFAFVQVTPGLQAIRGYYKDQYLPTHVISAEYKHVSFVEINIEETRHLDIKLYDAFSGESKAGEINILGHKEVESVFGEKILELPGGPGRAYFHLDAGDDYEISRHSFNRKNWSLLMPVVKSSWLNGIQTTKKISDQPDTGTVVGFFKDYAFEIFMGEEFESSDAKIVYFDKEGRALHKSIGQKGGGFIVYNVPQGLRTIFIQKRDGSLESELVVVEPGTVATFVKTEL